MKQESHDIVTQLDALFARFNKCDEPGLVVAVAHQGEVLYRRGFGMASLEHGVANTPATRLRIGSTSKHFTCLAALLLAEDGKLDIDAGIRTYLPELPLLAGDPSLRQLMTHTGGYRCYLDVTLLAQGVATLPRGGVLAAEVRQRDVNFPPGERMIYCNGGYNLLSLAIERVSGIPFETFLKERIFDVMGMVDTESVADDMRIRPRMATQHVPDGKGGFMRGLFPSWEVLGEGGIVSTVDDMLHWLAHLRGPKRVGSEASWRQMLTKPHYSSGAEGVYALGLMLTPHRDVETLHHAGGVFGGSCQMLTVAGHALDVIILTNGAAANPIELATQIVDIVLGDAILGAKPAAPLQTAGHETLLGKYHSRASGTYCVIDDHAGQVNVSLHNARQMPQALIETEAGLRVDEGAGGTLLIKPRASTAAARVTALELVDCGHAETLERLPDHAPPFADASAGLAGTYHSHDAAARATIAVTNGELTLTMHGVAGSVGYRLEPVADDIFTFDPVGQMAVMRGVLTVERAGNEVTRFRIDTSRTRNLTFVRERCDS
ncbi:serine hydrolase domain-containing protein [Burkholderia arboris]|uniref:serine hydrolase domain-containing protein n=1 Tax=Burkholderia arboris TaxID=488730 RepID=UPI0015893AF6|nr:serine hydrolase domain-containing protein [Burkholderia arboris]MBY8606684.1 beta-lactamase family protein [Burkholderia arboris]MCA8046951.1 beta-lactamase family protein [Burkholderia arboris]